MTIEHRAAASTGPIELCLRDGPGLALALIDAELEVRDEMPRASLPTERVLAVLVAAHGPLTRRELRDASRMRSTTVGDAIIELIAGGAVVECDRGCQLAL